MHWTKLFVAGVLVFAALPNKASAVAPSPDLTGIWYSQANFEPGVRNTDVEIIRQEGHYVAVNLPLGAKCGVTVGEPICLTVLVRSTSDGPVAQGIQGETWSGGRRYATPVQLIEVSSGRWRGQLTPLADLQRMSLFVRRAADGTLDAFIRNPESNYGARFGSRKLALIKAADGYNLRWTNPSGKQLLGKYDAVADTITQNFYVFPDDFVFRRASAVINGRDYSYRVPAQIGDGWETGSLLDAGIDKGKITDLVNSVIGEPPASQNAPYIQSILIARHGKLVLDEYFNGFDRSRPHDVRSAGKSVTTLMVGVALAGNPTITPRTAVYSLFPQYAPFANDDARKHRITVADLMTMSSGLACDDNDDNSPGNEDTMQSQTKQNDWYKYTLDLPVVSDPGTHAAYCSGGINLLGGVIAQATHQWLPDFFYDRFAKPMQFGLYHMVLTPAANQGAAMNGSDYILGRIPDTGYMTAYMAGGDYFLPRDFLKFGQLFLNHGRWNGREIVSDAWLRASLTPRSSLNSAGDYGYGWHLLAYNVGGRTYKAFNAGGNGGQILMVVPELDMAIMITGANYGQFPVWQRFITNLIPNHILSAVVK